MFFFNDTATTEIYTLSLHDALPICETVTALRSPPPGRSCWSGIPAGDRKSTRLNSSHTVISYAVFCLKKKNDKLKDTIINVTFRRVIKKNHTKASTIWTQENIQLRW